MVLANALQFFGLSLKNSLQLEAACSSFQGQSAHHEFFFSQLDSARLACPSSSSSRHDRPKWRYLQRTMGQYEFG
jgi:hypothetical protein